MTTACSWNAIRHSIVVLYKASDTLSGALLCALVTAVITDPCPQQFHNISLNHNLFDFAATIRNLTIFYGCPLEDDIPFQHRFNCGTTTSSGNTYAYYLDESLSRLHRSELTDCDTSIIVPVNQSEFDELWNDLTI
ncbi:hypothetical protein PVK06_030561 [Gossypium arboreum]|uniref:Uncharacterized protein n=1 Tax=Gossypium arboreum TaxID=29729 RepID=A0ABR0NQZ6_GOSAR|nr:hypothetical protein PVK06_030561 [Gossypium arboreum]